MKKFKKIPQFKNEREENAFWQVTDTTDYFDMNNRVYLDLTHLKMTTHQEMKKILEDIDKEKNVSKYSAAKKQSKSTK